MLVNSWYSEGTLERSGGSASFVKLAWMSKEQRQSPKLLKPRSFNAGKSTAAPIITVLDCSELDMEVSDIGIETTKSDDCKGISGNDRDANGLADETAQKW